ncbi:flagellar biosynthetic protein FliR [Erythrobacter jejuensis]|uniref:Flagellar biosynthetic protein FliR n=1 Tax=Parerythrobacter jejuensis TaxID=795812 RepID=A0A845AN81_9SPHN|nr:flagellar biosynthetic protein FliR [Parerythrobacter jejuensis]MXP33383.1 flagellar biosynthetic protein FliR [Parerythrobacter jejuensis]
MDIALLGFGTIEQELWGILFLSVRAGAAMMAAPLFGAMTVPAQLRAFLGVAIAFFIHHWIPLPALPDLLSVAGILALMQEAVIGFALGFVLQVSFAVPLIAAEQIAGTMGLAIATSIDPSSGSQSGVLGQYFSMMLIFIFLALGAHLLWLELLIESYRAMPPGDAMFAAASSEAIVRFAGTAFATAAAIALPVILVLLLVQLATGVLSRSAPSLNLFALGLPAGVLAGIAALIAALPILTEQFSGLSEAAIVQTADLIRP